MIGILGGMGTQAGLDFCNKLAILYRGKFDQDYPLFILYNKSNIPGRPESIGVQTRNLSNKKNNKKSQRKYLLVLKSLIKGCQVLKKSNFGTYISKLEPGTKTLPHIHTGFEEFLILEGELIDSDGKIFKKGDFISYEPNSSHSSYTNKGCLILTFMRGHNKKIVKT